MSDELLPRSGSTSRNFVSMLVALLPGFRRAGEAVKRVTSPWATWDAVPPEEHPRARALVEAGMLQQSAGEDAASCLTVTDMGQQLLSGLPNAPSEAEPTRRPTWRGHVLYWGEQVVKSYRHEAENQWAVLDKFEMERWPERTEDPSAEADGQTKKRRRETVGSLNREQEGPVRIIFHAVECGSISWERRDAKE